MSNKTYVIVSKRNDNILRFSQTISALITDYKVYHLNSYTISTSYWSKKWEVLIDKNAEKKFYEKKFIEIDKDIQRYCPQIILIINPNISYEYLEKWSKNSRIVFWFVDSIVNWQDYELARYATNFVYDRESQQYLQSKGIASIYCPVGYNEAYAETKRKTKTIDISFVGSPYKKRVCTLEQIAKEAKKNHWSMKVVGPFFLRRNVFKNILFHFKYPDLYSYIVNGSISPEEAADLYASSKICLNIHDDRNKGTNPRTFEIMATGSMELMDAREDYDITEPGKTVAVFHNAKEAVEKISYYLQHEEERERIAKAGQLAVMNKRSMKHSLETVLEIRNNE